MSGIYGVYRYNGAPVDPHWLARMKEAMAYYGPDGGACQIDGPIGMGHLLLQINPEDAFDRQPVRGERGLVVSTARLDNRDALLESFHLSAAEAGERSDAYLVSLAFNRWGEEVCTHLEGDWTLAAWDTRERRLFLARDAVGTGALYYFEGLDFFAFASSLKALLAIPGIAVESDRLRLAEVLAAWQHDAELTAYKDMRRLVWAHALSVASDGGMRMRRFWSAEGREPLRYRRDEEYVEAFLEHYTRAVQNCLRSQKPVAAELSGGRDSGSVVAMAAPLLARQGRDLTAFTSVPFYPPDGASELYRGNEWDLAHATATRAGANVQHVSIDAREYRVIQGIEHLLDIHDGPLHGAINHYWLQAMWEAASRSGYGTLLYGTMGNATVSWSGNGSALLALLEGYPDVALRLFLHAEPNPWLVLKRQVLKPLLLPAQGAYRRLRSPSGAPWRAYSALNPRMAKELDLDGRMRAAEYDPTAAVSPWQDSRSFFFSPPVGIATSLSSEIGAWHSFAYLDPTANLSLVEFLLRVPDDQYCRGRQCSWLYRRAFRNRVPDAVMDAKKKGMQSADAGHRIRRELAEIRDCLVSLDALPEAQAMLDLPLMHRCLEDIVAKVDTRTTVRAGALLLRNLGVGIFLLRLKNFRSQGASSSC
jgi:asparagine synthase (glutamine-hydrolysing)